MNWILLLVVVGRLDECRFLDLIGLQFVIIFKLKFK